MADSAPISGTLDLTRAPEQRRLALEVIHDWIITVDHKKIGLMYIASSLMFLAVGGFEALLMRIQLAVPNATFLSPQVFNEMFTMHGTTMIFFVAMPMLFGFANYLVPLMIGARDMAFPRLNAFSFWIALFGGLLLYFSFLGGNGLYGDGGAPLVGWFAYAPLTANTFTKGNSTDYWALGVLLSGIGAIGTALNIVTTTLCMRCKGMKLTRMPLLVWLMLVTSGMIFVAIPPLSAAQFMLLIDRYLGGHFFDTQAGGSAIIWMHFFWIFGHPEVYILVLPAFGFANEIIPVFSRKSIFGYQAMVAAIGGHWFCQPKRLGPPHVHGWLGRRRKYVFCALKHDRWDSDRHKNLQLAGDHVGRKAPLHRSYAVLRCVPISISHCGAYRHHAGGGSI